MTQIAIAPVSSVTPVEPAASEETRRTREQHAETIRRAVAPIMPGIALVLARDAAQTPAPAETGVVPHVPYAAPRRIDVPVAVVREVLDAAGFGGFAKATICVQPTYSTSAAALSWSDGCKDDVVVLTRVGAGWHVGELTAISPWSRVEWRGEIGPKVAIVVRKYRGQRVTVDVVVSPDSAFLAGAQLPTEAPAMSESAAIVIRVMASIKPSYRPEEYRRRGIGNKARDAAIAELEGLGFVKVNSAGSVGLTLAGKNAARLLPRLPGL
jgi:hypothetical protein